MHNREAIEFFFIDLALLAVQGSSEFKNISHHHQLVKVGFFQKVMAKFYNLSNRHACEPKIVSKLLFPVNCINTVQVIF